MGLPPIQDIHHTRLSEKECRFAEEKEVELCYGTPLYFKRYDGSSRCYGSGLPPRSDDSQ